MGALAKAIALPHEYAPQRFPSFPALERTALMGFNTPFTITIPNTAPTRAMLCRQAAYPIWTTTDVGSMAMGYVACWTANSALSTGIAFSFDSPVTGWNVKNVTASSTQLGIAGLANPLTYPIFGIDAVTGSSPYLYCPYSAEGHLLILTSSTPGVIGACSVTVRVWDSPGESRLIEYPIAAGAVSTNTGAAITLTGFANAWIKPVALSFQTGMSTKFSCYLVSNYSKVSYAQSTTTHGTVTFTNPTATTWPVFYPAVPPVEFANSTLPWYSTRTTASAALFTNVTQVLAKAGTVLGGRVAPHVVDPFNVTQSYITNLHPAEKSLMSLETGFYTYVPPSTDMVEFTDYTLDTTNGAPAAPVYRLDNDSLVNEIFFTSTSAVETLAVNVDWHIEFRTASTLFQIGLSTITLEAFHAAQLALVSAGFFFDNPDHKSVLGKITGTTTRIGKALLNAAAHVYPEVRAIKAGYKAARSIILDAHPKPNIVATSARASGIVATHKKAKRTKKVRVKKQKGKR